MKRVTIYTDGSSKGNPGPGGYGVLLRYKGTVKELAAGFLKTTNNRMELLAVIVALESLKEPCRVRLHSDSRYVVDAMVKGWIRGWKAKGWTRGPKREHLRNSDLWKRLDLAVAKHEIEWVWVKGHAGQTENERCDQIAQAAAEGMDQVVDTGFEKEVEWDQANAE